MKDFKFILDAGFVAIVLGIVACAGTPDLVDGLIAALTDTPLKEVLKMQEAE